MGADLQPCCVPLKKKRSRAPSNPRNQKPPIGSDRLRSMRSGFALVEAGGGALALGVQREVQAWRKAVQALPARRRRSSPPGRLVRWKTGLGADSMKQARENRGFGGDSIWVSLKMGRPGRLVARAYRKALAGAQAKTPGRGPSVNPWACLEKAHWDCMWVACPFFSRIRRTNWRNGVRHVFFPFKTTNKGYPLASLSSLYPYVSPEHRKLFGWMQSQNSQTPLSAYFDCFHVLFPPSEPEK